MNQFYHLLVKESLNNEDVAALSRDNVRDCHEIDQAFKTSNDCYNSYVYRTSLEILGKEDQNRIIKSNLRVSRLIECIS